MRFIDWLLTARDRGWEKRQIRYLAWDLETMMAGVPSEVALEAMRRVSKDIMEEYNEGRRQ